MLFYLLVLFTCLLFAFMHLRLCSRLFKCRIIVVHRGTIIVTFFIMRRSLVSSRDLIEICIDNVPCRIIYNSAQHLEQILK